MRGPNNRVHVEDRGPHASAAAPTERDLVARPSAPRREFTHCDLHAGSNLERDHPFSWPRCVVSLLSYALLLSDVLRTGLGLRGATLSHGFRAVEPDTLLFFGPTSYSVSHITQANATARSTMPYWLYKYDTTSISMRAFAAHLALAAWSPCVLYKATCDESKGLSTRAVFAMIDSLVDGVATHRSRQPGARHTNARSVMTLRTANVYKDRLHHYAFPLFFARAVKRTSQVIHFPYHGTNTASAPRWPESLCAVTSPSQPRPYACGESWTKWKARGGLDIVVWKDIPKRLAILATLYPNHTIDAAVLDGVEDFTRGGITYQGRKYMEIVLFARIRTCNGSDCRTVAVDDYRYEAAALVMNVDGWYGVVAALRQGSENTMENSKVKTQPQ